MMVQKVPKRPKGVKSSTPLSRKANRHVGLRIRKRRDELGLSREAVAEVVGVKHQQIANYERGKHNVLLERLLALAQALKVPPTYFFVGLKKSRVKVPRYDQRLWHFKHNIEVLYDKNKKHFDGLAKTTRVLAGAKK